MTTPIEPGDRCIVIAGNCPHSFAEIGFVVDVLEIEIGCVACDLCGVDKTHVHQKPVALTRKGLRTTVKPVAWLAKLPPESEVRKFDESEPVKVPERIDA